MKNTDYTDEVVINEKIISRREIDDSDKKPDYGDINH